jgi:hypothetical protein
MVSEIMEDNFLMMVRSDHFLMGVPLIRGPLLGVGQGKSGRAALDKRTISWWRSGWAIP